MYFVNIKAALHIRREISQCPFVPHRRLFKQVKCVAAWRQCVCVWGPYAPHEIGPSVRYVPSCYPAGLSRCWDMWGFSALRAGGVIAEGPLN